MRTLKFRAYDSATGKVSEPFDVKGSWGDHLIDFEDCSTDGALDSIIWEQFTGLLDRNGKEIYEGDIVKCEGVHGDYCYRSVVYAKDGWFLLACYTDCTLINTNDESARLGYYPEFAREIVGNIHENGEL